MSVIGGLLSLVLVLWAWYFFQALQRAWLVEQAHDAIAAAQDAGLALKPTGFRARLVAVGTIDGRPVRVEWRTGVLGPRSVVRGNSTRRLPLITSPGELQQALAR
ncbi:MAG: hypothetical protein H6742_21210 [Alphaproteobacteria bacterium]|nr:hypothetical protein [Alphaproteobacteria bacterium]